MTAGTVHYLVNVQLRHFATAMIAFSPEVRNGIRPQPTEGLALDEAPTLEYRTQSMTHGPYGLSTAYRKCSAKLAGCVVCACFAAKATGGGFPPRCLSVWAVPRGDIRMANGLVRVPDPINEPVRTYAPRSAERAALKQRLQEMHAAPIDIPLIIGGQAISTGRTTTAVCPHGHRHVLATVHQAGAAEVEQAVGAAREAWPAWSAMDWEARAAIFLKAAELLAGSWRDTLNAATMLNQSKTVFQAEIDAVCELIDFWRFNASYMWQIYTQQPSSGRGMWDYAEYRALEGFIVAVTPFNFTSIAGNLPTAPALMGNTVLWKPASTALLPAYYIMRLLEEAGLPPGVINFLPGRGAQIGDLVLASPELAGVHFTGSTAVFQRMWQQIGQHIATYKSYPRLVGETGGKDFVFAHPSADIPSLVTALVRGAFEFQGQKCSAAWTRPSPCATGGRPMASPVPSSRGTAGPLSP
jgi:1-pyrroline-5-carboxylate dehydrogenase